GFADAGDRHQGGCVGQRHVAAGGVGGVERADRVAPGQCGASGGTRGQGAGGAGGTRAGFGGGGRGERDRAAVLDGTGGFDLRATRHASVDGNGIGRGPVGAGEGEGVGAGAQRDCDGIHAGVGDVDGTCAAAADEAGVGSRGGAEDQAASIG